MSEISILNGYKIKDKKAVRYYDTISNMKSDTTLKAGMYVKTKGYYSVNDGGNAEYYIRTKTNDDLEDNGSIHFIGDLVAELIVNEFVIPEYFGAYGDSVHDDIIALNKCRDYCINKNIIMKGLSSSVYGISEGFDLLTGCSYDFNLATFKALNTMDYVIRHHKEKQSNDPVSNEFTKNIIIDCDNKANYGFYQDIFGWSTLTDNIRVLNPLQIGIYIKVGQIRLYNSKVEQMGTNNPCVGLQVDSNDNEIYNIVTRDCTTGIKMIGGTNTLNECHPVMFDNIIEGSIGFDIYAKNELINCYADTFQYGIYQRAQSGFEVINFRNVINTNYYTTERVSTAPYLLYSANNSVDWTSRLTMIGCSINTNKVYGEEYTRFSNYTKWNGSSLRLNNPQFNLTQFATNLPKEIRQNVSNFNALPLINANVSCDTASLLVNGNTIQYRFTNIVLPNVNANTNQALFENIDNYYIPENTIAKTVITEGGIVCRFSIGTNGNITIRPISGNITQGDRIDINEYVIK